MKQTIFLGLCCITLQSPADTLRAAEKPNVILIVCDDLNDYVEGFGGHPNAVTPNMARLAASGVSFTQAHCNIPICGPSRASLFTGIYPHNSGCYGFTKWDTYEVLKNSRTIMAHFRANGYQTLGTGKLMHHMVRQEWKVYGNPADYGPFPHDGTNKIAHPEVPAPFRDIGPVDGSFGPLVSHTGIDFASQSLQWITGGWANQRPLRVDSQQDRDPTADELNGTWAVENLLNRASKPDGQPFFMGVGFIRPHTPLIVPKKFFDMFPLDSIALPVIRPGDVEDTFAKTIRGIPDGHEPDSPRSEDMGTKLFTNLVASYDSQEEALKRFIQAYLASVASVDEQVGKILDAVNNSPLKDNTIIVLTSDHGWGMGEKNYLYKNSLWQESTRVPLIVRVPGLAKAGGVNEQPVSLVDLYPTLIDVCGLTGETKKNDKGHSLDGHSLKPFLTDPDTDQWSGPSSVLTALYKWRMKYDPSKESYSLRGRDWRYIRYENGKEELYNTTEDAHEWTNLASKPEHSSRLAGFREELAARLPSPGVIPPQPVWKAKQVAVKKDAEYWKNEFFKKHPSADTNKDGTLSWPEFKTHKAKVDALKNQSKK